VSMRRQVDIAIISDVHLGTPACRAEELLAYLKSIWPGKLVLNGDIIDMQQFSSRYWPDTHTKVVRRILKFAAAGVPVFYVTGNHEKPLRRYSNMGFDFGQLHLVDRLEWTVDGRRTLIVHGDECDNHFDQLRWLSAIGSWCYDRIEQFGNLVNGIRRRLGKGPISLTNAVKHNIAQATDYIDRYEYACAQLAARGGFDAIVCGHIHQPANRRIAVMDERPLYLNSGDWVENCSSLEYAHGSWSVERFDHLVESGKVLQGFTEETRAVS
jgi:UDP-2,3-diacylglucosamine pyrophosphatase LpxH